MAFDRNRFEKIIEYVDDAFSHIEEKMPSVGKNILREKVVDPVLNDIKKMTISNRPPLLMMIGRSGHGKSSLINALSKRKVAPIDDINPKTEHATRYSVYFEEQKATMDFIDTRGIFESYKPNEAKEVYRDSLLFDDIKNYRPDVLLHVINAKEVRAMSNDIEFIQTLKKDIREHFDYDIPILIVLSHIDAIGNPRQWPLEDYPEKAGKLIDLLDSIKFNIIDAKNENCKKLDLNDPKKGFAITANQYLAVIPICSLEEDDWNINTLVSFIGNVLPDEAIFDFMQFQNQRNLMIKLSSRIIRKFATGAGAIGTTPIPVSDMMILVPYQTLMIILIGALSGREPNKEVAREFFAAMGLNVGAGYLLKMGAQQLIKLFPLAFAEKAISGGFAASGTYGIGKAAEAYFFYDKIIDINDEGYHEIRDLTTHKYLRSMSR